MRFLCLLPAIVFTGAVSLAAWAGGGESSAEERFISPTAATSNCIGDPATPLCAVETKMACTIRRDLDLCAKVGVFDYTPSEGTGIWRYQVLALKTYRQQDIPRRLRHVAWLKPGYVEVRIKNLADDGRPCPAYCVTSYMTKPTTQGWEVVDWVVEGAD